MKPSTTTRGSYDLLSNPLSAFVLFCLPAVAIVVSVHYGAGWRTAVWTVALTILGTACLANAARCGRTHCYFTGPFFLGMAVVTLLYGLGILPLGRKGWSVISLAILAGAVAFSCLPEMFFGKYRRDPTSSVHRR